MKRVLLAAVLSALATGLVLATIGFGAQVTKKSSRNGKKAQTQSQQTQSGPPKTMKQVYDEMQKLRAAQDKKLADALGVSVDKLTSARDGLMKDRLDAQVKAKQLTQAQADAVLACKSAPLTCDRSNLPAGGRGDHRGGPGKKGGSTYAADLAKALGLDTAKVQSALQSVRPDEGKGFGRGGGRGHGHGGPGMGGPGMGGPGMGGPGGPGPAGFDGDGPGGPPPSA